MYNKHHKTFLTVVLVTLVLLMLISAVATGMPIIAVNKGLSSVLFLFLNLLKEILFFR